MLWERARRLHRRYFWVKQKQHITDGVKDLPAVKTTSAQLKTVCLEALTFALEGTGYLYGKPESDLLGVMVSLTNDHRHKLMPTTALAW